MLSDCARALANGDRAVEVLVEVLRRVAAVAHGAVLDQRLGVCQARLEGEAVDEGLQRRAGRAHGVGHVDGAGAGVVEIARRADVRDHLAGGVVDGEDGGRQLLPEQFGLLFGKAFERLLHRAVDGEAMDRLRGLGRHLGFRQVRRQLREGAAADGNRLMRRAVGLGRGDDAFLPCPLQHAVAGDARRTRVAVGATPFGRLRQGDEQGGLADRQPARLLAEVGERRGAHALDVAAERRQPQVQREDLRLRQMVLEPQGADDLAHLGAARALVVTLDEAGHLHGQRGGAGNDAAVLDELHGGARQRAHVDAAVIVEALVLEGHEHGEVALVDVGGFDGKAPAAVRRGEGAQQPVAPVEDGRRDFLRRR